MTARTKNASSTRVGLISDTHNLVRPEALRYLAGCDAIIHAGDICNPAVLEALVKIAPVTAVRGNNDRGAWAGALAETARMGFGETIVYVIHDLARLDVEPRAAGIRVVVSGHSHIPKIGERDGVLYINPGSAGRRRFRLPISLGELRIDGHTLTPRLCEITPQA